MVVIPYDGGDDAAERMHRRLLDDAVLRRADVDAAELVLGGDLAFDQFADLVLGLAQVLGDLAHHVLVDLDDLQLGLGDLALGLGARGDVLRALAGEPCPIALQRREPAQLHEVLVVEIADAGQLLLDQIDFLVLCLFLRGETGDLLVQLRDALVQLRLLAGAAVDADVEQLGFARHDRGNFGIAGAARQHRRKRDPVEAALLGFQPCGACPQAVEILGDDR